MHTDTHTLSLFLSLSLSLSFAFSPSPNYLSIHLYFVPFNSNFVPFNSNTCICDHVRIDMHSYTRAHTQMLTQTTHSHTHARMHLLSRWRRACKGWYTLKTDKSCKANKNGHATHKVVLTLCWPTHYNQSTQAASYADLWHARVVPAFPSACAPESSGGNVEWNVGRGWRVLMWWKGKICPTLPSLSTRLLTLMLPFNWNCLGGILFRLYVMVN